MPILGAPRADGLRERCAAVAWVQNAVANKLDPDIGPRRWTRPYFRFDVALQLTTCDFLGRPSAIGACPPRTCRRHVPPLPTWPTLPLLPATPPFLATTRPVGAAKPPAPAPQASVAAPAPKPQLPLASPGKRRWMMHGDLRPVESPGQARWAALLPPPLRCAAGGRQLARPAPGGARRSSTPLRPLSPSRWSLRPRAGPGGLHLCRRRSTALRAVAN